VDTVAVRLRHGLWARGGHERVLRLRTPAPADVAALADDGASPAAWAMRAVAAFARPVGARDARATAADLVLGDQAIALLAVRGLLEEGGASLTLACASCGEELEATVDMDSLAAGEPMPDGPWHEAAFPAGHEGRSGDTEEGDGAARIRFRLPTAGDLAAVVAGGDPSPHTLLSRIVAEPRPQDLTGIERAVADRLEVLDPLAEIMIQAACPACGEPVETVLDPVQEARAAVARAADRIEWEVHALASHYHWSEADILALPEGRRARYIGLVMREAA